MTFVRHLLVASICAAALSAAASERSGLGADSAVSDAGDCEAEAAWEKTRARGQARQSMSALRLGCGVGWRTELDTTLSWARDGVDRERGASIEAKTTLRESADETIGWALGVGIDARQLAGGRWRSSEHRLELEASRHLGSAWLLEASLGSTRDRIERRNSTLWGLGLEFAWSETVELRAEVGGSDRDKPAVTTDLRYTIVEDVRLKLSQTVRRGLPHERTTALALLFQF